MAIQLPDSKFSIIIPSYNDTEYLEACLAALYSHPAGESWNLIVVDDCSEQGHSNQVSLWAQQLDFSLIRPDNRLFFTRAVNQGILYAYNNFKPYWYFLLNSDTRVTPGWAAAIVETYLELHAHIVGGTLLFPNGRVQHAGAYGEGHHMGMEEDWIRWQESRIVPWATGAALALHKDVIVEVGMMPIDANSHPGQYDASDRNMCVTARQEFGFEIAVSAQCVIYHHTHQSREMRIGAGHIHPGEVAE